MLKQLPDDVKSYIRSGVAITSITQCVEELLLNSIDAGATCVAIRVDVGCFKIQVVDNGHGIPADDLSLIGNRYTTSKCHTVSDLDDLRYFGYRGEALASIKDACGILEIVSRTKSCSKPLCKLFQDGKPLPIKESAIPRPSMGTTITVHALFMNFPVRQKSVNESLELEKIRQRVAGLALMKPHVSVRLRNDSTGATIIHTKKCSNTLTTFSSLFGQTKADTLLEIKGLEGQFSVDGFIGREGSTKKDVQFVYINGRLVLKTKIHKLISQLIKKSAICKRKYGISSVSPMLPDNKDVLRKSPGKQLDKQPMFIVNVTCPLTEYDITFDPAKTLVEFKDWDKLLLCISNVVNEFLKKEQLFPTSSNQELANCDPGVEDAVQCAAVISPSNIRDVLISKTAKRHVPKSEISLKTPEGIPLEKWKSDNTSLNKPIEETYTSSSDGLSDNSVSFEHSASFKTGSKLTDVDASREKSIGSVSSCKQFINNRNENTEIAITNERDCASKQLVKENQIDLNVEASAPYKHAVRGRSALSAFRKFVGKSTGTTLSNMSCRANIDASMKRISKILPSNTSTCTADKSLKALSSLQKFRTFASKFEHKAENSDIETKRKLLPAKFNKINEVPNVKIPDTLGYGLVNTTNFNKETSATVINCSSSDVNKRTESEPNVKNTFDTNSSSKFSEFKQISMPDRKRPGILTSQTSSKMLKIDNNGKEEILPVPVNDPDGISSVDLLACCEITGNTLSNERGFDELSCEDSNTLLEETHQLGSSHLLHKQHVQGSGSKSDWPKELSSCSFEKSIRDEYNMPVVSSMSMDSDASMLVTSNPNTVRGSQLFKHLPNECSPGVKSMTIPSDTSLVVDSSPNSVRGSQLFKHLPYTYMYMPVESSLTIQGDASLEMENRPKSVRGSGMVEDLPGIKINDVQDPNNGSKDIFTAVPLDTNKLIKDIVTAGMYFKNRIPCENSSQENIPCSLSEELETREEMSLTNENPKMDDVCKTKEEEAASNSLMLDSTQEFTPRTCVTVGDQIEDNSTSSQCLIYDELGTGDSINKVTVSNISPSSTGFTPQMEDDSSSPAIINNTVNGSTTNDLDIADDAYCVKNTVELIESDNVRHIEVNDEMNTIACDVDVSQLSQDTLDMPSILESSRLDKSDVEMTELVSSNYWLVNEVDKLNKAQTRPLLLQHKKYQCVTESQDNDEVTVTQLLNMDTCNNNSSQSCETRQKTVDALTFRDIFTPTQTEHLLTAEYVENEGYECQNGENVRSQYHKDTTAINNLEEDLFTNTFDDEIANVADTAEPISIMKDNNLDVPSTTAKDRDNEEIGANHQKSVKVSDNESEADTSVEGDDQWIEMNHPETGKKMFIHSKLGCVRDSLDRNGNKQNSHTDLDVIRTPKKALSTQMNTSVRPKQAERILEASSASSSAIQKMLCQHFERDDESIGVKWRHKQGVSAVTTENSSVTDLFSAWENPVFNTMNKSVMSVETGSITNKYSLKAMKTLHTCKFTKDMLQTVQVVGQLDNKFIVCLIQTDLACKEPDMLAVVDQHAAHERVRLELLTEEAYLDGDIEKGELAKFNINPGKAIKIDEDEIQVMMCYRDEFSRIGVTFRVDTHVDNVIKVMSVPECLVDKDAPEIQRKESIYWDTIQTLIKGHVELLMTTEGAKGRLPPIIHKLLCSQACHGAIKFGDELSLEECKSLIHDLSLCDLPFQCAHGRPSVIPVLQLQQLETKLPQQKNKPQLQKLRLAMEKDI